jgi:heme/copper-type cytochrome/quinol oxidase subunit 2
MKKITLKMKKQITNLAAVSLILGVTLSSRVAYADAPSISAFLQNNKVQTALGWASIVIALVFILAIIVGLIKVVPVAMAFWRRRDGIDQGSEVSKGYLVGWGMLIVIPAVIIGVASFTFGSVITSAITTAVSQVFK